MKEHFLKVGCLYISVNEKTFHEIVDKVSEDYRIVKDEDCGYDGNITIYYAIDVEIPFPDLEQIGFIKQDNENVYE